MASKRILRDIGAVPALMKCALEVGKESSLKSVLSALWNLSAHCTENKADICAVEGALNFLVGTLTYKSPTRNWAVVENGGGILRNVSSHIATNEQYRKVLRDNNCLQILLRHLKSSSLTIVSNAAVLFGTCQLGIKKIRICYGTRSCQYVEKFGTFKAQSDCHGEFCCSEEPHVSRPIYWQLRIRKMDNQHCMLESKGPWRQK
ncbi:putative adenomatous polyposis coli protein isoform X1 [Apostichopus japonicus]|uniref:Putative adenomatous polyposis coli protein isoform X1 n=1 Tax=Stichopus japonicus TaxID=307972 RepID=A0A2G8LCC9_STIJA|nr:putative adenomatous polyposis coli protein isoform X1 [Apostichopus japonicus]